MRFGYYPVCSEVKINVWMLYKVKIPDWQTGTANGNLLYAYLSLNQVRQLRISLDALNFVGDNLLTSLLMR